MPTVSMIGFWLQTQGKAPDDLTLNARIGVHYSSRKPDLAVLETRFDTSGILLVVSLLGMSVICAAGLRFGWRFSPRRTWDL